MAQRFGGKYSPGGSTSGSNATPPPNKFAGKAAKSVDVRSLLMFVLPTPLLFAAIGAVGDSGIEVRTAPDTGRRRDVEHGVHSQARKKKRAHRSDARGGQLSGARHAHGA